MNEIVSSVIAFAIGGIAYIALIVYSQNKRKRRTTAEIIEEMWAKMNKQDKGGKEMSNIKKLRQKIENSIKAFEFNGGIYDSYEAGELSAYQEILNIIDSMPEENNPEPYNPVYDEDYLNEKIAKATKSWEGVNVDKMLADCRGYEEKPSEDLNDEIKKFIEEYGYERGEDKLLIAIVARHFAEWQKERMIKDAKEIITIQGSLTEPEFVKQRVIFLKEG